MLCGRVKCLRIWMWEGCWIAVYIDRRWQRIVGRRCGNCALVAYRIKAFRKAHQAHHHRYERDMRFGNQNKADLFYSGLLWSCTYAAHFQIGKVASPIFEQKSAIFINKLNYNKQRRNRGPMSWHAASSCVWRLPWRTSLPNIVWVGVHLGDLQSKFVILSENRLKSKIDVWLSLIWNDFFGPRPSNWGVILSFPKQQQAPKRLFPLT